MDYHNYSPIEFILDDDFFRWVVEADAVSDKFWQRWLAQHPHKKEAVEEARKQILELGAHVRKSECKEMPEKEQLWEKILAEVEKRAKPSDD